MAATRQSAATAAAKPVVASSVAGVTAGNGAGDRLWSEIRSEAEAAIAAEPALGGFIYATVLSHDRLEDAICHRVANRVGVNADANLIMQSFQGLLNANPDLAQIFRDDLEAVRERDPACNRYIEPLLFFKGFHALATYRFAHEMLRKGRRDFAFYLQSEGSRLFAVDIHPAARLGRGIMLDHATGVVIGETAVVGDNCSFLHAVTLGGSGKETGDRHPKIGTGVLIGAGAKILGNIHVGNYSKIAAGSVVLSDVPPGMTAAGVPARIVGSAGTEPARCMDQCLGPDAHIPDDYACL
jgi:serine O-acetyltransferase